MDIKRLIKKCSLLSSVAYITRQKRYTIKMKKYRKEPLSEKKVLLYRSSGGYGDNPKAIAEYLHSLHPEIDLVWAYPSKEYRKSLPDYVKPVLFESEDFFKEMATAGAWVCSSTLPMGTLKRDGQLYIQTWHGDKGFKKFANDAAKDNEEYRKKTKNRAFAESQICDYFVTGSKWFIPKIKTALGYNGTILPCGLPRNDRLIRYDRDEARDIKRKLGIDDEIYVVLYAPTFRDHEKSPAFVDSDIDIGRILSAIEEKTGRKSICLIRAHSGRSLHIGYGTETNRIKDVTTYPDMADLLMISDMLITDYSSCAGDFALLNRFVMIYQDDIESYTTKDRTLYFDMNDSPYFVAHNINEAIRVINYVDEQIINDNCAKIREFYDVCETGEACQVIADIILKNVKHMEENK